MKVRANIKDAGLVDGLMEFPFTEQRQFWEDPFGWLSESVKSQVCYSFKMLFHIQRAMISSRLWGSGGSREA